MPIPFNIAGCVLAVLFCLQPLSLCHAGGGNSADGGGVTTRALWHVTGFIHGPDAKMTNDEILSYQGRPLNIDDTSLTFGGTTCSPITITRSQADTASYFSKKLFIHQDDVEYTSPTVGVIKTNCDIEGFEEFVRLNDRRLLVSVQGVVFILEPNVNY
ncbi:hypothetical protein [Desulfopila inferna]|uniref:hypothetical protein n=1 Tax=Desulfopila inferna TaxID=468528 RepID=UPI00196268BE|nr:hypothetical protein [Desulfopila inferna]MBM9605780.1 hypothetical protein [Desulfopila inferna]